MISPNAIKVVQCMFIFYFFFRENMQNHTLTVAIVGSEGSGKTSMIKSFLAGVIDMSKIKLRREVNG